MELEKRVKAEASEEAEVEYGEEKSNSLWSDLQFNLDVQIPAYLVNLLTLMGFDNALSLKLMTSEDVDHVEQMVQSGIRDLVEEERLGDYVGVYRKHPDKFRILPGHRKILDSMIQLLNQLESYGAAGGGGAAASGEPTSSSAWNGGGGWTHAGDPDVEIVVEPETTQGLLPLLNGKRKTQSVECEGFGRGKSVVKRKCVGPEASLEEPVKLPELRELLYDILKRWIDQSQSFFETPYTIACVNISLDRPRVLANGALGEPTAVVTCLVCRSTVRIQCLPCRYKPGPTRRWVISNFQRHVKRAHFKPEFRPPPDVSTSSHNISFENMQTVRYSPPSNH